MSFYIAEKNEETGKFELSWANGKPQEYTKEEALKYLPIVINLRGTQNIKFLEEVPLTTSTNVKVFALSDIISDS